MFVGAGKWSGFGEAGESGVSSLVWKGWSGGSEVRSKFMGSLAAHERWGADGRALGHAQSVGAVSAVRTGNMCALCTESMRADVVMARCGQRMGDVAH